MFFMFVEMQNSQLFKLTYGALVNQLLNFCDNAEDVNEQLQYGLPNRCKDH